MHRLLLPAVLALVVVPTALADGGGASLSYGMSGVTAPGSAVRYVALPARHSTVVAAVRKRDGAVVEYRSLVGYWGIPNVTVQGTAGGLSRDRRLLVLADASPQTTPLRRATGFLLLGTRGLATRRFVLRGDFAYDALSPDRATLYLIQHVTGRDLTRYRVRAYDLRARRLLPGSIADRSQGGWTMAGSPVARATSPDGRWVYTMYRQPRNYPFVHALDTLARRAVCVAVPEPWKDLPGTRFPTGGLRLDGRRLLIADRPGGATRYVLDTTTFRVSEPGRSGPPIALAGIGAVTALLLAGTLLAARRRSARGS